MFFLLSPNWSILLLGWRLRKCSASAVGYRCVEERKLCLVHFMYIKSVRERERERESRLLTTHQHILGYTVSFTLYDFHTMDSRQLKMTDDRLQ